MRELGVIREQIIIGNCYGQIFDQMQQEVREELIGIRNNVRPDAVFYPCKNDIHQDHKTLSSNAFRIFRDGNCYGYEVIRSSYEFQPQVYFEITKQELDKKIKAVMTYKSQLTESAGYYFSAELLEAEARFRGGQCGMIYSEAFECYRQLIKR
jgi:LmbE family N-acetylglucosaminyl deacetylase